MATSIWFLAFLSMLLCSVEALQIRKTLKLEGDKRTESVGDKPEVDGEREEVYNFFDKRYGQNEEDLRSEEVSVDQQQQAIDHIYDVSHLAYNEIDGDEEGPESDYDHTMELPTSEGITKLTLDTTTLAYGVMESEPTPYQGVSYVDFFRYGLSTSARSSGSEVYLGKGSLSSKTEGNIRLFSKDGHSNKTCSPIDPTKVVDAVCGNHYLFPGQSLRMVSAKNCPWRFRHLSPEVIFSMKGLQLEKDFLFSEEERLITFSVKMASDASGRKLIPNKKLFREVVVTTPDSVGPDEFDGEICVPAVPGELLSEYEGFETSCCTKVESCGEPAEKDLFGRKLTMHALPWEAVLTVRGTPASASAVTFCSGSLISSEWMLTTASCFIRNGVLVDSDTDYAPEVIVSFGLINDSLPVETHSVTEVHVFPSVTETHDIALVKLKKPSSRTPVCLPSYTKPNPARNLYNREGLVFGWVVRNPEKNPYMNVLKQKILGSDKCSTQLGKRLPPHVVCTADTLEENRPCLADGDLLTVVNGRFVLSGLSLPRLQCVNDLRPHTAVAYFMNWIGSVTGIPMPSR